HYRNRELQGLKPAMTAAYRLEDHQRLALVDICLPALHMLSEAQRQLFVQALHTLVAADDHISAMEWALARIVRQHLGKPQALHGSLHLRQLREECQLVLAFIAHAGNSETAECEAAFKRAAEQLRLGALSLPAMTALDTAALDRAMDRLARVKPLQKPQLLKAMATCIEHDGQITAAEAELFRAIADSLGCPVPPLSSPRAGA